MHSEEHCKKREEATMRGRTVYLALAMLALVAALYLPAQWVGAQQVEKFDLEKAIAGAKTRADHEAIASYYEKEGAAAKAKAAEHRRLAETYRTLSVSPRSQVPSMENHCRQLAQTYESAAADNAALAQAHRQMAQGATQ
jgi:hypothetical protein